MTDTTDLRLKADMLAMSCPSTIIRPYSNFTSLMMAVIRELFPAPVRPTTMALVPAGITTLTFFKAGLAFLLYLSRAFSNWMEPA